LALANYRQCEDPCFSMRFKRIALNQAFIAPAIPRSLYIVLI